MHPKLILPAYDTLSEIGAGNSAAVYTVKPTSQTRCRHSNINTHLACKLISSSKLSPITRREVALHATLRHPHIAQLYAVLPASHSVALLMEYANQGDLFSQLLSAGSLPPAFLRKRLLELCSALRHIHTAGILHLDLKLENIAINQNNQAKLLDFGCARPLAAGRDPNYTLGGTLHYLPPEAVRNPFDCPLSTALDCWALGVLTYTAVSGAYPFDAPDDDAIRHRILHDDPSEFPDAIHVPADFRTVIKGLLQKDPEKRMTLEQVVATLQQPVSTVGRLARRRLQRPYPSTHSRTRTPSPASTVGIDFGRAMVIDDNEDKEKCECLICDRQSKDQMLRTVDSVLAEKSQSDSLDQEEQQFSNSGTAHTNEHEDLCTDDDLLVEYEAIQRNAQKDQTECRSDKRFPRVDSMMSACSSSSHEMSNSSSANNISSALSRN